MSAARCIGRGCAIQVGKRGFKRQLLVVITELKRKYERRQPELQQWERESGEQQQPGKRDERPLRART